jgi:predicted nucleotidyltransferase
LTPPEAAQRLPPLVERTVERLIAAFRPERVVLFGSFIKGTFSAGSDIDLLVIANLPGEIDPYRKRARQLAAGCFPPIDVALATHADLEDSTSSRAHFLISVLSRGITIYQSACLSACSAVADAEYQQTSGPQGREI